MMEVRFPYRGSGEVRALVYVLVPLEERLENIAAKAFGPFIGAAGGSDSDGFNRDARRVLEDVWRAADGMELARTRGLSSFDGATLEDASVIFCGDRTASAAPARPLHILVLRYAIVAGGTRDVRWLGQVSEIAKEISRIVRERLGGNEKRGSQALVGRPFCYVVAPIQDGNLCGAEVVRREVDRRRERGEGISAAADLNRELQLSALENESVSDRKLQWHDLYPLLGLVRTTGSKADWFFLCNDTQSKWLSERLHEHSPGGADDEVAVSEVFVFDFSFAGAVVSGNPDSRETFDRATGIYLLQLIHLLFMRERIAQLSLQLSDLTGMLVKRGRLCMRERIAQLIRQLSDPIGMIVNYKNRWSSPSGDAAACFAPFQIEVLHFVNLYNFPFLSSDGDSRQLYGCARRAMEVDGYLEELQREVKLSTEALEQRQASVMTKRMNGLTVAAVLIAAASVVMGFWGGNFFTDEKWCSIDRIMGDGRDSSFCESQIQRDFARLVQEELIAFAVPENRESSKAAKPESKSLRSNVGDRAAGESTQAARNLVSLRAERTMPRLGDLCPTRLDGDPERVRLATIGSIVGPIWARESTVVVRLGDRVRTLCDRYTGHDPKGGLLQIWRLSPVAWSIVIVAALGVVRLVFGTFWATAVLLLGGAVVFRVYGP